MVMVVGVVGCAPATPTADAPGAEVPGGGGVGPPGCPYPVDAPVSDGFRPPAEPWSSGNRGLAFATVPGQPVRAVTAGTVTFAGRIAHHWYVTVRRADGRDLTYSYLAATDRTAGEHLARGDPIGISSAEPFHLGHRDQGSYLDPGPVVAQACGTGRAILVALP